jgi:hypothetical protein
MPWSREGVWFQLIVPPMDSEKIPHEPLISGEKLSDGIAANGIGWSTGRS